MPKKRNIIQSRDSAIGRITVAEEFAGAVRKEYIENAKSKTNYLSITKSELSGTDHSVRSRLEVGEKYITYTVYAPSGKVECQRRFNRITKSAYSRTVFLENEKGQISIIEYNGEKKINFTIKKL